jgi:hypothetical protein
VLRAASGEHVVVVLRGLQSVSEDATPRRPRKAIRVKRKVFIENDIESDMMVELCNETRLAAGKNPHECRQLRLLPLKHKKNGWRVRGVQK